MGSAAFDVELGSDERGFGGGPRLKRVAVAVELTSGTDHEIKHNGRQHYHQPQPLGPDGADVSAEGRRLAGIDALRARRTSGKAEGLPNLLAGGVYALGPGDFAGCGFAREHVGR